MAMRLLWTGGLLLAAAAACFRSDFLLYGPPCEAALDCDDALGDGDARRACFRPDAAAERGYCTELCDADDSDPCPAPGDRALECLEREGAAAPVCALVCEADADCPKDMRCVPDPQQEERGLCGF